MIQVGSSKTKQAKRHKPSILFTSLTVFDQNIKSENYVSVNIRGKYQIIYSTSPTSSQWISYLIFSGPNRNFGKPKRNRLDFEIVTVVICTLSLATSAAFQFLSKIMISTKFHISNQIHLGVDDTAFVKKNNIFIE